jgi:hypothetical protein
MHIILKIIVGVVVLLGAILALSSKKENRRIKSDRPLVKAHTYYYYPKANFYYDSTAGKYIRWDSAATEWKTTDQLPVQEVDLGKRVRIGESINPVWLDNQEHRLIYSVSLYSAPKDFKKKEKPLITAPKQKQDTMSEMEKGEKKSGVKKFFERIFPPKKEKDTEEKKTKER